jgi:serine/threonine-protein kinase
MQNKPDIELLRDAIEEVTGLRFIGEGGFKAVYEAIIAGEKEALKVIFIPSEDIEQEAHAEILSRVKREIESLRRCECSYLVQLGTLEPHSCEIQGHEYLVYSEELLEGTDLLERIHGGNRPAFLECKALLSCLLKVIRELKAKEIIHRDIKPGNVMALEDSSRPFVVLDLGIAFKLHSTPITMNPDMRHGTLPYMAPEMFEPNFRELIDYRSDLYSAAVTIYEYASGVHPIARRGEDDVTTMYRIATRKPYPLASHRPDLPTSFCEIIDQLIRKKPMLRPSNLDELLEKVEELS